MGSTKTVFPRLKTALARCCRPRIFWLIALVTCERTKDQSHDHHTTACFTQDWTFPVEVQDSRSHKSDQHLQIHYSVCKEPELSFGQLAPCNCIFFFIFILIFTKCSPVSCCNVVVMGGVLECLERCLQFKCIIIKSSASWCKAQLCCVLRAEWEDEQETLGCQLVSASVGLTLQTMISTAWSGREWNCSGSWRIWWDLTSSSFPMSINRAKTLKNSRSPLSGTDRSFTLPQRAHTFFCDALIQTDKTIK